ncbi:AMP-binding protein [Streptomyces sp. SID685]|uniref:AMP-binding protein n=1 Tax=Streptomyces griseofuscus TaxID=146922 RepID=UPI00136E8E8F|nr:AMP-binding protein [Streptomyces sp. SID685]
MSPIGSQPSFGWRPVAILAVLWSGATYVPIDPGWPIARRAAVLRDAQVRLLLAVDTAQDAPEAVQRRDMTTLKLLENQADAPSAPRPRPHPGAVYVMFTSGSTGSPKGVEVRSSSAASLVASVGALIGIGPDSVFVSCPPSPSMSRCSTSSLPGRWAVSWSSRRNCRSWPTSWDRCWRRRGGGCSCRPRPRSWGIFSRPGWSRQWPPSSAGRGAAATITGRPGRTRGTGVEPVWADRDHDLRDRTSLPPARPR